MRRLASSILGLLVILAASCSFDSIVNDPDPQRYAEQIAAFTPSKNASDYSERVIVFVGSSSIRRWKTAESFPGLPILNRGFGGSQISDINYFVEETVLNFRPDTIVFYAGENDIAGRKSSERVLADYQAFVDAVMAQDELTDIIFVSIKPSPKRWSLWPKMSDANEKIRLFSSQRENLYYADVAKEMLDESGELQLPLYVDDGIHLSPSGYDIWTKVVGNALHEIY